jgi:hypothetical protein
VSLTLANDYAMGFKEAQDLVRMPCLGLENPVVHNYPHSDLFRYYR